jgi:hypothetical protein
MRLPQLPLAPCKLLHPQSHNGSDQVVDFTTFCTLILPLCRIRFTCAVCSSLPIASFRPCRYQQRPCDSDCLPPGQGDICFLQQTGGASYAGQTKGRAETLPFKMFIKSENLFCFSFNQLPSSITKCNTEENRVSFVYEKNI